MKDHRHDAPPSWPDALYLIGCLAPPGSAPSEYKPSAEAMGFKAFNLLRMAGLGLPVPPAFAIGTAHLSRCGVECAGGAAGAVAPRAAGAGTRHRPALR